ncbi:hypothetical protein VKS41_004785 [Umbelopsis sp. WA50703]
MSTSEFTANFEPLEVCGSGSFGVIRKVRRISDGQILACKEIDYRKMSEKEKRQLVAEVNILRELKHPNIVRYYERIIDRKNCMLYILMEYCDGGDLSSVIRKCKQEGKYLQEEVIWVLFTQLLMALRECHHGKTGREDSKEPVAILHRDLKPDNVFLDEHKNVKLGDFGLSRTLSAGSDLARTFVGTPFYMSPELINESSYDIKSDLWALGCLTFELCALEPPFKAKTQMALAAKIKSGKTGPFPKQYSPQLYNMIKAMMHNNPAKRPTTLDFFKLEKIQRCRDSIEIKLLRTKIEQYERDMSDKQQRFDHRMAEIDKRERALTNRLQKVSRREEIVAQKERQIQERVQELSLHARQQEPESFQVPFHRGMSRSMSVQPSSRYTSSRLSMEAPSIVIPGRDTLSTSPRSSISARSTSPLQDSAGGSISTASSSVSSLLFSNDDTAFYDAVTNLTLNQIPKPDKACHIQIQKINDIPSAFLRSA